MSIKKEEKNNKKVGKCFVIMPISDQGDYPEGHFQKVYEQIFKPAIEEAGYEPYRVDENTISDSIIGKIFEALQNCEMALCDLSNRNPNVLYELGIRQAYDKPVVLVQDCKTERIFDVSGISTVQYKSQRLYEDVIEAREKITKAIVKTKQGNIHTMVQIAKAKTAEVPEGTISKEDNIEIMLSRLVADVRELKENRVVKYNWSEKAINDWASKKRMHHCIIFIDKDLFKQEVYEEVELIRKKYQLRFSMEILDENKLIITWNEEQVDANIMQVVVKEIEQKVGKFI